MNDFEIIGLNQDGEKLARCRKCEQEFFVEGDEWSGYIDYHICSKLLNS